MNPLKILHSVRSAASRLRSQLPTLAMQALGHRMKDRARRLTARLALSGAVRAGAGHFLREVVWPPSLINKLGRILATLSVLSLIQYGFAFGLAATVTILLEYYDALVGVLLGWAQPYIQALVHRVAAPFDWGPQLLPHWKHVYVLLGAYFFRSAAVNYSYGYRGAAWFCGIWGAIVALGSSAAAGTISLREGHAGNNLTMAAIPVAGIFIFDMAKQLWNATFIREKAARVYGSPVWTWWEFARHNLLLVLAQTVGSLVFVWVVLRVPWVSRVPSPGLAALAFLVLAIVVYRVGVGAYEVKGLRRVDEAWSAAFWRTNSAGIVASILSLVFWTAVFLLASAGLKFYGL